MTQPTNSIDSELRAELWKLFKSTPDKKDGRGTVNHFFDILIPHLAAKYVSRKEVEEALRENETNYPSLNLDKIPHKNAVIRNRLKAELRAKLLPPTKGDIE